MYPRRRSSNSAALGSWATQPDANGARGASNSAPLNEGLAIGILSARAAAARACLDSRVALTQG